MHSGKQMKKFSCVQGCSDCCIYREHYPSVEYGKIGVLLLPEEKAAVEQLAKKRGIKVKIVPRLAVGKEFPERILAYQMMGKNADGDLCPFLDVESTARSPHGGFNCTVYSQRPLACRAYPVIDAGKAAMLDGHCQFCKKFSTTKADNHGLEQEIEALAKIKSGVTAGNYKVWRYATAAGKAGVAMLPEGWVAES
jgi:Fe-S-cluster containining protein